MVRERRWLTASTAFTLTPYRRAIAVTVSPRIAVVQALGLSPAAEAALRAAIPVHRDDPVIISTYGAEYRGIVQFYLLAGDVWRLNRLEWVAKTSLLKTLAAKHRSRVTPMSSN